VLQLIGTYTVNITLLMIGMSVIMNSISHI